MTVREELRLRLMEALRPGDKTKSVGWSASEMAEVRKRCEELEINYGKLLSEVCQTLSAEKKR